MFQIVLSSPSRTIKVVPFSNSIIFKPKFCTMIKNPFAQAAQGEANLKRNAYDLSFQNLFSTHFGRLTPAMMQEVLPGDSFEIDSSLAIQGMPTVFPLQTRVRVSVEYYYCRNRCVMDDFEDFIFKTKDVEQCWLKMNNSRAKKMISTGSLGDFFGVPSTYMNDTDVFVDYTLDNLTCYRVDGAGGFTAFARSLAGINTILQSARTNNYRFVNNVGFDESSRFATGYIGYGYSFNVTEELLTDYIKSVPFRVGSGVSSHSTKTFMFCLSNDTLLTAHSLSDAYELKIDAVVDDDDMCTLTYSLVGARLSEVINPLIAENGGSVTVVFASFDDEFDSELDPSGYKLVDNSPFFPSVPTSNDFVPTKVTTYSLLSGIYDSTDDAVISQNPFVGSTPSLKINALPYRHYTQVCNYYHRNDKNNPYMLNGEAQYNEFIPSHATGADENEYDFCYRNWELDRFTSAVQSPQFGEAPLVGLTFSGADTAKLTFQDADDPNQTYTATLGVEDDRITDIADFSKDIPSANLRKLQEMISYGISINDLRVTNSFQRFLENVLRRGLRYRSQLKSHFGVSVDYPDIDIPQYIGGYSGELTVGKVTSTAETSEAGLGDFNGSLSGQISSQHKIRCYCPEHGYILCLVSLTPIPVYSQVCAKNMIKTDPFDYFLPEFGKIGFVPMHYSEVMPLQTAEGQSVNDVFGYQKAWYDYMMNFDQIHSYFRTNMKDFVLQRIFAERPELVKDFTVINPNQLSDVFVTGNISDKYDVNDKFLCNFYTHMISKRCIPRVGTPSLE